MKTMFLIPCKEHSTLDHKNRFLFPFSVSQLKNAEINPHDIYIYTDDEYIKKMAIDNNYKIIFRSSMYSKSETQIKKCLEDIFYKTPWMNDYYDTVMMLYLTFPLRSSTHILDIYKYLENENFKSLITVKKINGRMTPARMLDVNYNPVWFNENMVNRQDFPIFWERFGYIIAFRIDEIKNLNNQLYNKDSVFYEIDRNENTELDIDSEDDFVEFMKILAR